MTNATLSVGRQRLGKWLSWVSYARIPELVTLPRGICHSPAGIDQARLGIFTSRSHDGP
ncbi:hypothetical protein I546_2864 [Mycobacterium kansasii 732]|nr:hypothetical protein I546_2864 [Mycobacterium kansasii 732]